MVELESGTYCMKMFVLSELKEPVKCRDVHMSLNVLFLLSKTPSRQWLKVWKQLSTNVCISRWASMAFRFPRVGTTCSEIHWTIRFMFAISFSSGRPAEQVSEQMSASRFPQSDALRPSSHICAKWWWWKPDAFSSSKLPLLVRDLVSQQGFPAEEVAVEEERQVSYVGW